MFIFGQALLQSLIGAECENVDCALPQLSHENTSGPVVITCACYLWKAFLAENQIGGPSGDQQAQLNKWVSNEFANMPEMRALVSGALNKPGSLAKRLFTMFISPTQTHSWLNARSFMRRTRTATVEKKKII